MLRTSLVQLISSVYSIDEAQIEIGQMEWMKNEAIYAEVNILPLSSKQMAISRVKNVRLIL